MRPGERGHVWPQFLPDGRHFLYLADSAVPEHHNLFVSALGSHARTRLMPLASNATYTRDGYLLFARDRRLIAQPFDATRLARPAIRSRSPTKFARWSGRIT